MRRALARLLAIALTLGLSSAVALAALAELAQSFAGESRLPLYFNAQPRNVHDLAESALQRLSHRADARAEQELVRLGGAALPHVLPELDSLSPSARARVALALRPLARRMGVGSDDELATADSAVTFWSRFWQDRAFDFRPQVVRRLVSRLAEHSNALRYDDLIHLDTYAVPELLRALGRVGSNDDLARAERLTLVLSHVTERAGTIDRRSSREQAARALRGWRRFALEEAPDFATLDGPMRVLAMFSQTRYGAWFGQALERLRTPTGDESARFGITADDALRSLLRFVVALGLGVALAVAWTRREFERAPSGLGRALAVAVMVVPASFLLFLFGAPRLALLRELFIVAACALLASALLSRASLGLLSAHTGPAPGRRAALRVALRALPAQLGWLTSSLFALELLLGRSGVAEATLFALGRGELDAGMSLALCGALLASGVVTLSSARERTPPPLRAPMLVELDTTAQRRVLALAALLGLALLALAASSLVLPDASGWGELAQGARSLLAYGLISYFASLLVGTLLGVLATSGSPLFEHLLVLLVELSAALPAVIWAAALTRHSDVGVRLAVAFGALRGIDIAWLTREHLLRLSNEERALAAQGGIAEQRAWLRRRLRPALPSIAGAAALLPAWGLALGVAGRLLGQPVSVAAAGWDALLAPGPSGRSAPGIAAALLAGLICWTLLSVPSSTARRIAGLRSTRPPAGPATEVEPSPYSSERLR